MRAAFLTPALPWPANSGGSTRTYYLLRQLAQRHTVDLYTFHYGAPPDPGPLATQCNRLDFISLGERYSRWRQLWHLLQPRPRAVSYFTTARAKAAVATALTDPSVPYDLIICDEVMMTPYIAQLLPTTPRLLSRPKIDHIHYAEMAAERPWGSASWLDWLDALRFRHYEPTALQQYTGAVVCSPDDRATTLAQGMQGPLCVVPNGADTDYFRPQRQPDPRPTVLLLGTMHYYPNIDAVHYFFRHIYPTLQTLVPEIQVLVVGHSPPPDLLALDERPGVTVTGSVADVRPYMARSWVMAVPLRLGGGTRLKITEAFATTLPVVSTTIGAQGLAVNHAEHLLLADEPQAFAHALQQVLTEPAMAQRLSASGHDLVQKHYSWQALGQEFVTCCERLVATRRAGPKQI